MKLSTSPKMQLDSEMHTCFSYARFNEYVSSYHICSNTTRFLSPMDALGTEAASVMVLADIEVVTDHLHGRDFGTPERMPKSFTAVNGEGGSVVK